MVKSVVKRRKKVLVAVQKGVPVRSRNGQDTGKLTGKKRRASEDAPYGLAEILWPDKEMTWVPIDFLEQINDKPVTYQIKEA